MSTWSCSCVSSGCEAWTHKHTHGTTTVQSSKFMCYKPQKGYTSKIHIIMNMRRVKEIVEVDEVE